MRKKNSYIDEYIYSLYIFTRNENFCPQKTDTLINSSTILLNEHTYLHTRIFATHRSLASPKLLQKRYEERSDWFECGDEGAEFLTVNYLRRLFFYYSESSFIPD